MEGQVAALSDSNGWIRDTAQRLLVESASPAVVPLLKPILGDEEAFLTARVHSLRTLAGLGQLNSADLITVLSSSSPELRRIGCQVLAELTTPDSDWQNCIPALITPQSGESRIDTLHRVIALSAMKENEVALEGLFSILRDHGDSPHIRLAALSQWDDYQVERLSRFLSTDFANEDFSGFLSLVNEVTRSALYKDPNALPLILEMIGELDSLDLRFSAVVAGIDFAFQQKRWNPPALSEIPPTLTRGDLPEALSVACQKIVAKLLISKSEKETLRPWTEQERRWAKSGARAFASSCSSCHGSGGQGLPGLGPSLQGSEWLLGEEDVPIRIILDGLTGPITVDGEVWDLTMPGHRENPKMTDTEISALLTWIRRQWGHGADPVSPKTVQRVREKTADRKQPWTAELLREGSR